MNPSRYIAPGTRYYALAQHAVLSILGTRSIHRPVVLEKGISFYNVDTWWTKILTTIQTQLLTGKNEVNFREDKKISISWTSVPKVMRKMIKDREQNSRPRIVVAPIADTDTTLGVAFLGGCNHEAFHTIYTPRVDFDPDLVERFTESVRTRIRHNEASAAILAHIEAQVEDIRIEILGGEEFPGTKQSLYDIHDWSIRYQMTDENKEEFGLLENFFMFLHVFGFDYPTHEMRMRKEQLSQDFPDLAPLFGEGGEVHKILQTLRDQADAEGSTLWASLEIAELVQSLPTYEEEEKKILQNLKDKKEAQTFLEELVEAINDGSITIEDLLEQIDKPLVDQMVTKDKRFRGVVLVRGNDSQSPQSSPDEGGDTQPHPMVRPTPPVKGEMPWSPVSVSGDRTVPVPPSAKVSQKIYQDVMRTIGVVRAQLRNILLTQQFNADEEHGLLRGSQLSPTFIGITGACLQNKEAPTSAFYEVSEGRDISAAACIVLDESPSMNGSETGTIGGTLAFIEPLESVGGKTLVVGIRDSSPYHGDCGEQHHRGYSVTYRLYKTWEQSVMGALPHLGGFGVGGGGTPLADGIYFGMTQLFQRSESIKFLVVMTDGEPNHRDRKVIQWLLRVAQNHNIHMIGVGIGSYASGVEDLFPESIVVNSAQELPIPMVKLLRKVMRPRPGNT